MSRIEDILDLQKKSKSKNKKKKFNNRREEEGEKVLQKLPVPESTAPAQANRTVVSVVAEEDEDEEMFYDEETSDIEEDVTDEDLGEEVECDTEEVKTSNTVSVPENVFAYDDDNATDIDDVEQSLLDIFVNRMFKQDPVSVHKAVAHTMATDLKPVSLFLFNWYGSQDSHSFTNYDSAKSKVVNVLRMRYGKFNDESEFTHAVAHWFVNGVLGIRK